MIEIEFNIHIFIFQDLYFRKYIKILNTLNAPYTVEFVENIIR
jgi:hypothetical protein